jgi:hypothetical protein
MDFLVALVVVVLLTQKLGVVELQIKGMPVEVLPHQLRLLAQAVAAGLVVWVVIKQVLARQVLAVWVFPHPLQARQLSEPVAVRVAIKVVGREQLQQVAAAKGRQR